MAGYGDDAGFEAWLEANGYELASDLTPAQLRQRGSAYVDGLYGARFPGTPAGGYAQERAWPRAGGSDYYGSSIPADVIPTAVVEASYLAAYREDQSPGSLTVITSPTKQIKRVKAGDTEVEYAQATSSAATSSAPTVTAIEGLLAAFLNPASEPAIFVV